ncbi:hypothetical protein MKX01_030219 [Papaver californicum]|nr:hypothetical protein MKX01_030219 [Papaver californicum]
MQLDMLASSLIARCCNLTAALKRSSEQMHEKRRCQRRLQKVIERCTIHAPAQLQHLKQDEEKVLAKVVVEEGEVGDSEAEEVLEWVPHFIEETMFYDKFDLFGFIWSQ